MMIPVLAIAGAGLTISSCWGLGILLRRALRFEASEPVCIGVGATGLSTVIFALAAVSGLYLPVLLPLLFGLTAAAWKPIRQNLPNPPLLLLLLIPFAGWYFIHALAPEVSADGNYYHLTYARQYLEHHGFFRIVSNMYASFPQGLEMLFLPAIAIGGFSAAALVHLSFLFVLIWALVTFTRFSPAGVLASILVFASPVIGYDASIAYNDVALGCCTFLAFVAASSITVANPWNAIPAGLLAGFCFAIKYTGALTIPFVVVFVAIRTRSIQWTLIAATTAFVVAGPWLVKNWIWLDNPVSPFFNRVFPNPHVRVELEDQYRANMQHFGGHQINASTPLELTTRGAQLQGLLGPVFLLAPLAFIGSWRLALIGLFFAIPWTQNLGTRFLIPAIPFFALALGELAARIPWASVTLALSHAVLSLPPVVALYAAPGSWRIPEFPLRAALRIESEDQYKARRIGETFGIVQMINAKTEKGAIVYTALPLPDAYCDRTVLLDYTSALSNSVRDGIKAGPVAAREQLKQAGVGYLLIHRDEPVASAIETDEKAWGVEKIAESGPGRLYKVL